MAMVLSAQMSNTLLVLVVTMLPVLLALLLYLFANATNPHRRRACYSQPYDRYHIILKR